MWRVARTPEQIRQGMIADDGRGAGGDFTHPGIDKDHKGEQRGAGVGGKGCVLGTARVGRWGPRIIRHPRKANSV